MRVNSPKGVSSGSASKKTRKKGGKGFSPIESNSSTPASAISGSSAATDIDSILALQAIENVDAKALRKRAVLNADKMLSELDKLKVSLLSGRHPKDNLLRLKRLLDSQPDYNEAGELRDVIDQIKLRVEVEIAKFSIKKR